MRNIPGDQLKDFYSCIYILLNLKASYIEIQSIMRSVILLLSVSIIHFTVSQIPNPDQYRFTLTTNGTAEQRLVIDNQTGRMSRLWFSKSGTSGEEFGGNQFIYKRNDSKTYFFNFMMEPIQCIISGGGPPDEVNYWPYLIQLFGGEQKKYDELIFDSDCDGTCLTWRTEFNGSFLDYHYVYRLYVKKAEQKPIKMIIKAYDLQTKNLISTTLTAFTNWMTGKIPDYEYDYPMNLTTCIPI